MDSYNAKNHILTFSIDCNTDEVIEFMKMGEVLDKEGDGITIDVKLDENQKQQIFKILGV